MDAAIASLIESACRQAESNTLWRETPAFLVGVTGYMELAADQCESLHKQFRLLFRFLRSGGRTMNPAGDGESLADALTTLLVPTVATPAERQAHDTYLEALSEWPGLGQTPIVVMTNLAPGVDSIATCVALESEFQNAGFHVRAPLPFPHDLYRQASTFVRKHDGLDLPGNAERQAHYDGLLEKVRYENTFPVQLASDVRAADFGVTSGRYEADLDDRDARNLRYFAAGEYLAVYCHLLVAVWDGKRQTTGCGTAAVVNSRLCGPGPGVLPTSSELRLAHGGPLLHVFASRPAAESGDTAESALPPLRLLHPITVAGPDATEDPIVGRCQTGLLEIRQEDHEPEIINARALKLQRDRLSLFRRTAEHLTAFIEQTAAATPVECNADLQKLLTYLISDRDEREFLPEIWAMRVPGADSDLPPEAEGEFSRALRGLVSLRHRAATAGRSLAHKTATTLWLLFLFAGVSATSLHVFAHWHSESHEFPWVRVSAGALSILLAACGLSYFCFRHARRDEEWAHDCRALAEGLRIQFYWNLAGLGRSVSANYMQRQRSELDWIRAAIRSIVMPYERWHERFSQLPARSQLMALECVRYCWVSSQHDYFADRLHAHLHKLHCYHRIGSVLALSGLAVLLICVLDVAHKGSIAWIAEWCTAPVLIAAGLWMWATYVRNRRRSEEPEVHPSAWWVAVLDFLAPRPAEEVTAFVKFDRRLASLLGAFASYVPLTLVIASILILSCLGGVHSGSLPEAHDWGIIFGGASLLYGGLVIAWTEKNLLSELAYQYSTMHELFHDADIQLESDLRALRACLHDPVAFASKVREIQEYLFALGREALDENAEWLLLHRARPLEPVMAG